MNQGVSALYSVLFSLSGGALQRYHPCVGFCLYTPTKSKSQTTKGYTQE
jgi:hypothetical protein